MVSLALNGAMISLDAINHGHDVSKCLDGVKIGHKPNANPTGGATLTEQPSYQVTRIDRIYIFLQGKHISYKTMVFILDGCPEHVAHAWCKKGIF